MRIHYFCRVPNYRISGDGKEKLPIKNDEESSLVAEEGLFYDPFWVLNKEKALLRQQQGFFFVAETVEISNLLKDISEIINLSDF
jgi:hypothetical protein